MADVEGMAIADCAQDLSKVLDRLFLVQAATPGDMLEQFSIIDILKYKVTGAVSILNLKIFGETLHLRAILPYII